MFEVGEIVIRKKSIEKDEYNNIKLKKGTEVGYISRGIRNNRFVKVCWPTDSITKISSKYHNSEDINHLEILDANCYEYANYFSKTFYYNEIHYIKFFNYKFGPKEDETEFLELSSNYKIYKTDKIKIKDGKVIYKKDNTELKKVKTKGVKYKDDDRYLVYSLSIDSFYHFKDYYYVVDFKTNNIYAIDIDELGYLNLLNYHKDYNFYTRILKKYKEKVDYIRGDLVPKLNMSKKELEEKIKQEEYNIKKCDEFLDEIVNQEKSTISIKQLFYIVDLMDHIHTRFSKVDQDILNMTFSFKKNEHYNRYYFATRKRFKELNKFDEISILITRLRNFVDYICIDDTKLENKDKIRTELKFLNKYFIIKFTEEIKKGKIR